MKNKENESVGQLFLSPKVYLVENEMCFMCYGWLYKGQSKGGWIHNPFDGIHQAQ